MDPGVGFGLERQLVAIARSSGPLRAALAQISCWLVERKAWERPGHARLSDYADERAGLSARSLYDSARVAQALGRREAALRVSGLTTPGCQDW